jgi:hypothetical protein
MRQLALERSRAFGYSKPLPTQLSTEVDLGSQSSVFDHSVRLKQFAQNMVWVLVDQAPTSTNFYVVADTNPDPLSRFAACYQNVTVSDFRELALSTLTHLNSATVNANWTSIVGTSEKSLTYAQIEQLIDELTQALNDGKFDEIDRELSSLDPNGLCVDAVVALSRATYPARTKLREWSSFVKRAIDVLKTRGDERAMLGLI